MSRTKAVKDLACAYACDMSWTGPHMDRGSQQGWYPIIKDEPKANAETCGVIDTVPGGVLYAGKKAVRTVYSTGAAQDMCPATKKADPVLIKALETAAKSELEKTQDKSEVNSSHTFAPYPVSQRSLSYSPSSNDHQIFAHPYI